MLVSIKKEAKSVENIDKLIHDIQQCKSSLDMLLIKIENEQFLLENQTDWTTIMNSLKIVSSYFISICKFIRDKREMTLKTYILVPKHFSEDVDPELKVTERIKEILKNKIHFGKPIKLNCNILVIAVTRLNKIH